MWPRIKNYYHLFQALAAAAYYHFPSKNMKVIGVTGTDGKSTTSSMIYEILKKTGAKVALVNSLGAKINGKLYETGYHVTTPNPFVIQKFLKQAKDEKCKYFILEATSHGLDQNRLAFVNFHVAVITNVTNEHLNYHKTWQNYLKAKAKLFKDVDFSILNAQDKSFNRLKKTAGGKILTYNLSKSADFNPYNFPFKLKILGSFNKQNALAAAAATTALGINKKTILSSIAKFVGIPGRMQKIDNKGNIDIFVDFAHTPNALFQALSTLKPLSQKRKSELIIVFGAAGERDKLKRPEMGKVAAKFASKIILTAEDPRHENVQDICSQIAKGIIALKKIKGKDYFIIDDRKEAIDYAIKLAKKGDIVAIFGKGHEKTMTFSDKEIPWSEEAVARLAVAKLLKR